jgi:hypothetical protein
MAARGSQRDLNFSQSISRFTYEAGAGGKTSETVIHKIFDERPVP